VTNARPRPEVLGAFLLVFAFFAGPVAWSLHLVVEEILVSSACSTGLGGFRSFLIGGYSGWEIVLLLVTLLLLMVSLVADIIAFRAWRTSGLGTGVTGFENWGAWMALSGILLSTLFLIATVMAGIPIFFLSGCS
jgi:hypothetical protein